MDFTLLKQRQATTLKRGINFVAAAVAVWLIIGTAGLLLPPRAAFFVLLCSGGLAFPLSWGIGRLLGVDLLPTTANWASWGSLPTYFNYC